MTPRRLILGLVVAAAVAHTTATWVDRAIRTALEQAWRP